MSACTGYDIYKILVKDKTIGKYIKDMNLKKKIRKVRDKIFENIKDFKLWLSNEILKLGYAKLTTIVVCNYVENVYTKNVVSNNSENGEDEYYKSNGIDKKELKRLQHRIKPITLNKAKKFKSEKKSKNKNKDFKEEDNIEIEIVDDDDINNNKNVN